MTTLFLHLGPRLPPHGSLVARILVIGVRLSHSSPCVAKLTPDHPVVGVPVCLSVCACVVQCLVAVVSLFRYIRQRVFVCVCARARARTCVHVCESLSLVCVCARAHDRYSDSVACQQDGVSLRIFRLSRRFRERLYADDLS